MQFTLALIFSIVSDIACSHVCTYTTQNATYDLQPLSISSESTRNYHLIHDKDTSRNYSYYFNFCNPVHQMPLDICTNSSKRPEFAQGYCRPNSPLTESNLNKRPECPAEDIIQINGNGLFLILNKYI